jgi:hypothetical protein
MKRVKCLNNGPYRFSPCQDDKSIVRLYFKIEYIESECYCNKGCGLFLKFYVQGLNK